MIDTSYKLDGFVLDQGSGLGFIRFVRTAHRAVGQHKTKK